MQCRKCGKELRENAKFCEHCGGSVLPDEAPFADASKQKKKGKGKYWIIGVASFLFAACVLVAVFFGDIAAFTERLLLSPEMLMKKAVASVAQDMSNIVVQSGKAPESPIGYRVSLFANDTLKDLLLADGQDDWISDLHLQITAGKNGDLQRTQMSLKFAEESIITLDVLQGERNAWIAIPELDRRYLKFDQNYRDGWNRNLPTRKEMMGLFRTYGGILFDSIHRVTGEKTTLQIENVRQKVLKLTATVRREDMSKALGQIARELREDETARKLLNQGAETDIHGEFVEALEELAEITDLELQIICYLDSRNNLIGVEAVSEEDSLFYWAKAVSGGEYASRLSCGSFVLVGTGIYNNGKQTGQSALTLDGTTVLSYRCEDFSINEKGFSGSLLFPIDQYLEGSALGLVNVEISVELARETVAGKETFSINLIVGEDQFAGLQVTEETVEEFPVEVPEQTLPADEQNIEKWLEGLDWSGFLKRLYDAGVPINALGDQGKK